MNEKYDKYDCPCASNRPSFEGRSNSQSESLQCPASVYFAVPWQGWDRKKSEHVGLNLGCSNAI